MHAQKSILKNLIADIISLVLSHEIFLHVDFLKYDFGLDVFQWKILTQEQLSEVIIVGGLEKVEPSHVA